MISKVVEGGIVASATAISPKGGEVFRVSGSTAIQTINPPLGPGQNQVIYLIPTAGTIVLGTSGNILIGITMAQNRVTMLLWLSAVGKWYIESGV